MADLPHCSPAFKISAQAVPSGKGSLRCSSTMIKRRMGIINNMPRMPPKEESKKIRPTVGASPRKNSAGIVNTTPAANPSPTVAIVWTMLCSKIVVLRKKIFINPIDRMAAGIDAEIVCPIFSPR